MISSGGAMIGLRATLRIFSFGTRPRTINIKEIKNKEEVH